ncbi:MAG: PLP-dependent aminotransferase family protein, partial [Bryobacteraceae bacterium]|nr:PLP-dependent aminotransferase family protein [Bryobacteraceae bacterium]
QRHFTAPGSVVLVEDPVYHGLRNVFDRSAVRLVGLPVTSEGVRPEDVERAILAERPQLVVLTPNFQNPTGLTIPLASREAIARIIERYGITLVENDIYGDLRYRGEALPTIRSLQTVSRGILIRSFSKTVFPGLRVGWMIGPTVVTSALAEIRQWCDLHTDHLSQAILLRFKESGRLKAHLARVQEAGRQKLDAVLEACAEHLPAGSAFTRPQGGMNLWVTLPREIDAADLLSRARREGVTYIPGRMFSVGKVNPATLRLSFGGLPPERIRAGIATLGRLFRDELQRSEPVNRFDAAPALV